jgi:glycosyltransferase involved in cell wall biosynthesis
MKVIHFITSIDQKAGGTAVFLKLLASKLSETLEVLVVTGNSDHPLALPRLRIRFLDLDLKNWFCMIKQFQQILAEESPDVVHIHGIWQPQTWLFQREAQRLAIKVVLSPHGMMEPWILQRHPWKKKLALVLYQRKALRRADYLHATALLEKENLKKLGYTSHIQVVAIGIELELAQIKTDWIPRRKLLFLSRIHPKKGIEFLVEAVARLKSDFILGKVIIAGEGDTEYIESLKQKTLSEGVDDIFEFVGGVYGDRKWELYREADLFVLPTHSENFGNVVVEALACGTPVITTKGTPWQELELRNCGWWIDIGTGPLVNALQQYLSMDHSQLEEMGRNGLALVKEKYSADKMLGDMLALYKNMDKC